MRAAAGKVRDASITALVMLAVQAAFYLVAVRDDVRDLKRDVSALQVDMAGARCDLAFVLRRPTLPTGCVIQQGAARP